jgi:hypothetical protein
VGIFGRKRVQIGNEMGRTNDSCRCRYRVLPQQAESAERQAALAAAREAGQVFQAPQLREYVQNDLEMTIDGGREDG